MFFRRLCALVPLVSVGLAISCGGGSSSSTPPSQNNPIPTISSLSPTSTSAGGAAFTLTVNGSNFLSVSTAQWNGNNRTTTYVSASQLTTSITASDIAAGGTWQVTVVNPSPGGGTSSAVAFNTNNPAPTVTTISPNSSEQVSTAFTLSVVGANFTTESQVNWNGAELGNTTLVNSNLLTLQMPANATATSSPDSVTVVNPSPGGGTSNSAGFSVPCPIPATNTAASTQTHARLGAYYFDGWSMALTNFHFQGLPFGPYQGREPLTGWQDNTNCSIERQLAWAHSFGIDFFVFDWYFNSEAVEAGDNLNSALEITHALSDRHGMHFAILYVDSGPFTVQPADWSTAAGQWIGYMQDQSYARVAGRPLLVVLDMNQMRTTFGSSANVAAAFNQLRAAARSAGLPGVYIMGDIQAGYDHNTQSGSFPDLSAAVADGYDGLTIYNWSFGTDSGLQPFSVLTEAGQCIWSQASLQSRLPFVPVSMTGWDPRPWSEGSVWFTRTAQDVTGFLDSAIKWTAQNPTLAPEPSPNPPIILMEAWNEFGEGSHILPTVEDQTAYGDALAQYLSGP